MFSALFPSGEGLLLSIPITSKGCAVRQPAFEFSSPDSLAGVDVEKLILVPMPQSSHLWTGGSGKLLLSMEQGSAHER